MKTLRLTLLLGMLFTTFNLLAQSTPQKSFDVMKSLAWRLAGTYGTAPEVHRRQFRRGTCDADGTRGLNSGVGKR